MGGAMNEIIKALIEWKDAVKELRNATPASDNYEALQDKEVELREKLYKLSSR